MHKICLQNNSVRRCSDRDAIETHSLHRRPIVQDQTFTFLPEQQRAFALLRDHVVLFALTCSRKRGTALIRSRLLSFARVSARLYGVASSPSCMASQVLVTEYNCTGLRKKKSLKMH